MNKTLIILVALLAIAACAENPVLPEWGNAVRSMTYHQTANPETLVNPDPEAVAGYSGPKGEKVLEQHNNRVSTAKEETNVVNLKIGGDN